MDMTFIDKKTGKSETLEVAATWKDPIDGTVQIDKSRCIGCGACAEACPYGARYVNPDLLDEVSDEGKADKCTFCKPRVEAGYEPACVQTCITGARIFGDISDPKSEAAEYIAKGAKGIEAVGGELGPNVYYYGKPKDLTLLFQDYTPEVADLVKVRKRAMLAKLVKPAIKKAGEVGLLGIVGSILMQNSKKS
jgi:tetrathionate reductase subunit B